MIRETTEQLAAALYNGGWEDEGEWRRACEDNRVRSMWIEAARYAERLIADAFNDGAASVTAAPAPHDICYAPPSEAATRLGGSLCK